MAEIIDRGPFVNVGSLMDTAINPMDGPSIDYQGNVIPDPRFSPMQKDGLSPARVPAFFNSPYIVQMDGFGQPTSTTAVAPAQAGTANIALSLATSAGGLSNTVQSWASGVPLIPYLQTAVVTVGAIDFGFSTSTTTANNSTLPVPDSSVFKQGQWLCIGGVGNLAKTTALLTQVMTVSNFTQINVSPAPLASLANAPIAQANLYSQLLPPASPVGLGPAPPSPNATNPYLAAGLAACFDPLQALNRNLTVTCSTIVNGTGTILVTGYDVYGVKMTELITANGSATVAGNKAWKYVQSIVPQSTVTTVSIGIGNLVGFNCKAQKWEYLNVFYNGGFMTTNTGYTSATTVAPTNNTAGDVRGTLNLVSITNGTIVNGTARITIMASVPLADMINATPLNSTSLFGIAQSTT